VETLHQRLPRGGGHHADERALNRDALPLVRLGGLPDGHSRDVMLLQGYAGLLLPKVWSRDLPYHYTQGAILSSFSGVLLNKQHVTLRCESEECSIIAGCSPKWCVSSRKRCRRYRRCMRRVWWAAHLPQTNYSTRLQPHVERKPLIVMGMVLTVSDGNGEHSVVNCLSEPR
jgi:hypothetical protein